MPSSLVLPEPKTPVMISTACYVGGLALRHLASVRVTGREVRDNPARHLLVDRPQIETSISCKL